MISHRQLPSSAHYDRETIRASIEPWGYLSDPMLQVHLDFALARLAHTIEFLPDEGTTVLQVGDCPNLLTLLLTEMTDLHLELGRYLPAQSKANSFKTTYCASDLLSQRTKAFDYWTLDIENRSWPWSDQSYDGLILEDVVHQLRNRPGDVLAETHRILKPSGWLLITTPNAASYDSILNVWLARQARQHSLFSLPALCRLVETAGFKISKAEARPLLSSKPADIRARIIRRLKSPWLHEAHLFVVARKEGSEAFASSLDPNEPCFTTYLPDLSTSSFLFRENSLDEGIFRQVVSNNEYQLPERFGKDDVLIDIGAHIGSFSYAALRRGAGRVYAIEANAENYELTKRNLAPFVKQERAVVRWGAVWRSDRPEDRLFFGGYSAENGRTNTGGGGVIWRSVGEAVPAIPFDDLVNEATQTGQNRIRMVKIDCEGAEWPILLTSAKLDLIDTVCGEFHEIKGEYDKNPEPLFSIEGCTRYTVSELQEFLARQGFRFKYRRFRQQDGSPSPLGVFCASR